MTLAYKSNISRTNNRRDFFYCSIYVLKNPEKSMLLIRNIKLCILNNIAILTNEYATEYPADQFSNKVRLLLRAKSCAPLLIVTLDK